MLLDPKFVAPTARTQTSRVPSGLLVRSSIKGVIFDKDGTLFDFQATWGRWASDFISAEAKGDANLALELAEALGFDPVTCRFHSDSAIAMPTECLADRLGPFFGSETKAQLIARLDCLAQTAQPVEAGPLAELLWGLKQRGLLLGLATNDVWASTRVHLATSGIEDVFDFVACIESGFGSKPEPGQLLAFAAYTGLEPGHCLMVGDSVQDLLAARAAGMHGLGVTTGLTARESLTPLATDVLQSVSEIPDWLGGQIDARGLGASIDDPLRAQD